MAKKTKAELEAEKAEKAKQEAAEKLDTVEEKPADKAVEKEDKVEKKEAARTSKEDQILEMMAAMNLKMEKLEKENKELKDSQKKSELGGQVSPMSNKVKLVSLRYGGLTLRTSIGKKIRFEDYKEDRYLLKEDLEDLVYSHQYDKIFREIGVYICDKQMREDLLLSPYYEKYNVHEDSFVEMLTMEPDELYAKLKSIPLKMAEAFATYVIDENKAGNKNADSRALITTVGSFFKIDLYEKLK